jgi:hypothetical protein
MQKCRHAEMQRCRHAEICKCKLQLNKGNQESTDFID